MTPIGNQETEKCRKAVKTFHDRDGFYWPIVQEATQSNEETEESSDDWQSNYKNF